ncbi:DNA-directed DNA polymerase [Trifolium repens]|nr:DNA-directed DNA polymerase [Trifolium repens]
MIKIQYNTIMMPKQHLTTTPKPPRKPPRSTRSGETKHPENHHKTNLPQPSQISHHVQQTAANHHVPEEVKDWTGGTEFDPVAPPSHKVTLEDLSYLDCKGGRQRKYLRPDCLPKELNIHYKVQLFHLFEQYQPALEKDRYKIREAFIAAPGNSLIVADYGHLELRILAHLTNCKSMLEAFEAGGDFHSIIAMNMYPYIRQAVDNKEVLLEWHPQPGEDKPPLLFLS